jgi:hypothetical protein
MRGACRPTALAEVITNLADDDATTDQIEFQQPARHRDQIKRQKIIA